MALVASATKTIIDPKQFTTTVELVALVVHASKTNLAMQQLKPFIFDRPKMKSVLSPEVTPGMEGAFDPASGPHRAVLLGEEVSAAALRIVSSQRDGSDLLSGLPDEVRHWTQVHGGGRAIKHVLTLGYELLTVEQVLRKILPMEVTEIPSAFETAGHVAHLNLREEVSHFRSTWRYMHALFCVGVTCTRCSVC